MKKEEVLRVRAPTKHRLSKGSAYSNSFPRKKNLRVSTFDEQTLMENWFQRDVENNHSRVEVEDLENLSLHDYKLGFNSLCSRSDYNTSIYLSETLLYDELLRYIRGRADDIEETHRQMGSNQLNQDSRNSFLLACRFREEWRKERENEILRNLNVSETLRNISKDEQKSNFLRVHLRRSIHVLISSKPQIKKLVNQTKTKISQDLLYAQQLDRILSRIDKEDPSHVMLESVVESREKIKAILENSTSSNDATSSLNIDRGCSESVESFMLQLYENVADAKLMAKQTKLILKNGGQLKEKEIQLQHTENKFLLILEEQRTEKVYKEAEALAIDFRSHICATRIQRRYKKYRAKVEDMDRQQKLEVQRRHVAARVLQARLGKLHRIRKFIQTKIRKLLLKNQSHKIAIFCFWRWIYKFRCSRINFELNFDLTAVTKTVVTIQALIRKWSVQRLYISMRNFQKMRLRREIMNQWTLSHQRERDTGSLNQILAEDHYRFTLAHSRAKHEILRDKQRFEREWQKYEDKLLKNILKSKLLAEWIPQLDQVTGEKFYLNAKTGNSQKEHPNDRLFKQLVKKQHQRATALYQEQHNRMKGYLIYVEKREESHRTECIDELQNIISQIIL